MLARIRTNLRLLFETRSAFSRSQLGTSAAARLTNEQRLGQPNVIRPSIAADCCRMTAMVVAAVHEQAANVSSHAFA
jgi:hypothetical protein